MGPDCSDTAISQLVDLPTSLVRSPRAGTRTADVQAEEEVYRVTPLSVGPGGANRHPSSLDPAPATYVSPTIVAGLYAATEIVVLILTVAKLAESLDDV